MFPQHCSDGKKGQRLGLVTCHSIPSELHRVHLPFSHNAPVLSIKGSDFQGPRHKEFSCKPKQQLIQIVIHQGLHVMPLCLKRLTELRFRINTFKRCHIIEHCQAYILKCFLQSVPPCRKNIGQMEPNVDNIY